MAGLIWLNEDKSWSAATWAFAHVLRVTRPHLPKAESSKILELMDKAEIPGVNYMSLENLTSREVQIFREALETAYQEQLALGPESFAEPEFFPGFMEGFWELLEMMPKDQ